MQHRQTYDKLPLQANVYPMPTAMFIQDSTARFSVLTAQALGVFVMKPGQLAVYRPWVCLSWLQACGVFVMKTGMSAGYMPWVFVMITGLGCVPWLQALGVFVMFICLGSV